MLSLGCVNNNTKKKQENKKEQVNCDCKIKMDRHDSFMRKKEELFMREDDPPINKLDQSHHPGLHRRGGPDYITNFASQDLNREREL